MTNASPAPHTRTCDATNSGARAASRISGAGAIAWVRAQARAAALVSATRRTDASLHLLFGVTTSRTNRTMNGMLDGSPASVWLLPTYFVQRAAMTPITSPPTYVRGRL